jgi:uncharacterized protein (DUF1015 family)
MIAQPSAFAGVELAPPVQVRALSLRPGWFHLARPGVADRLVHPHLDESAPVRSACRDLDVGFYLPVPPWEVAIHRVSIDGRTQVGLVLEVAVADYLDGRIRPHEATRGHAVESLADHLTGSGVDVAPVTLAHRSDPELPVALAELTTGPPTLTTTGADGAEHAVWLVDAERLEPVLERLSRRGVLYVVDGHHRCAAAAVLAGRGRGGPPGADASGHMFALVVGEEQLEVSSYHVLVSGVTQAPGALARSVVRALEAEATPVSASEVDWPEPGVIDMWHAGRWLRTHLSAGPGGDATRLHEQLIEPVFGITRSGDDRRLEHVPGTVSRLELQERCPEGTVAFVVHPPTARSLFATADEGDSVPAKSSLFHPKVPAGLFLRRRDACR